MLDQVNFPQIPQQRVANLSGVSPTAIRTNLANEKLKLDKIATKYDLVVKERINLESIYDYLEVIVSFIRQRKISKVEQTVLKIIIAKSQQIKTHVQGITRQLRKEGLYRDEALILATAISVSCPSIKENAIKQIIAETIKRKVKSDQIVSLQKEFIGKESSNQSQTQFSLIDRLGELLEERESDVLCAKCGNSVYLQVYSNNKKTFACKHCS